MNFGLSQRVVLLLGAVAQATLFYYPPWCMGDKNGVRLSMGFYPFNTAPARDSYLWGSVIDTTSLICFSLLLLCITAICFVALKRNSDDSVKQARSLFRKLFLAIVLIGILGIVIREAYIIGVRTSLDREIVTWKDNFAKYPKEYNPEFFPPPLPPLFETPILEVLHLTKFPYTFDRTGWNEWRHRSKEFDVQNEGSALAKVGTDPKAGSAKKLTLAERYGIASSNLLTEKDFEEQSIPIIDPLRLPDDPADLITTITN